VINIFDKLCTRKTGQLRPLSGVVGDIGIKQTGNSQPMGFGTNDEYKMTLTLEATFWAGSVSTDAAFKQAKMSLLHNLYADLLPKISEARSAVIGQDYETVYRLLNDMEQTVLEET